MSLKIVGAGFGRTGTLSLKEALEKLGFDRCYHMMEVFEHPEHIEVWSRAHNHEAVDWDSLFSGYQASVDWPSCNLWREQLAHYPDARVLLSVRDPDRWYDSIMSTIYKVTVDNVESSDPVRQKAGQWAMDIIWNWLFDGKMDNRAHVIGVYNRHNDTVRTLVPADKLLVFEASQGWAPLCRFLEVPVPAEDYPRVNTREQFATRHEGERT